MQRKKTQRVRRPARWMPRSRKHRAQRSRGFTLLELMLVVTVIGIVAAMALPGFANARKHANEASAISSLRTFSSAETQYRTRFGLYAAVPELASGGFVDDSFSDGERSGYRFISSAGPSDVTWAITAQPVSPGVSGNRWFRVDESGVIRVKDGAAPSPVDPAVD
jgi:prepilin-type N-terminal cleavage/methylation domain-containing protein